MPAIEFDRDEMAEWYANQHLATDPGVRRIYYLTKNAPVREIRFIEINDALPDMDDDALEPIDFGVDAGAESEHKLFVLDVTPRQWASIEQGKLALPNGWSLDDARVLSDSQQ